MMRSLFLVAVSASLSAGFQVKPILKPCIPLVSKTALLQSESNEFELTRRDALIASTGAVALTATSTAPLPALAAITEKLNTRQSILYLEAEFKDTVNTNGAPEKHLPLVQILPSLDESDKKTIEIQVPHVMDPEKPHFIEFIWLKDVKTHEVLQCKAFKATDASPPTLTVKNVKQGSTVKAMLFCNLHGLWQGEDVTVWMKMGAWVVCVYVVVSS